MGWLGFLNPAFLWGAFAASLPVIIHLINRRKARVVRFPAVQFVLRSERRVARRYRLKQWLLLALRTLLLFLLTTALAEPVLQLGEESPAEIDQPRALALILDNSLSLAYQTEGTTRWELAREAAGIVLRELRPQDQGVVLPLISTAEPPQALSSDRELLLQHVTNVSLEYSAGGFVAPFQQAYSLLKASSASKKEILVITDMTRTPWVGFELGALKVIDSQVRVTVVSVGTAGASGNTAVREIRVEHPPVVAGVRTKLTASVAHFGGDDRSRVPVQLSADGRVLEQRLIDLPHGTTVDVSFDAIFEQAGYRAASVKLASDALPIDDTFYFTISVRKPLRALVIDGDPRTTLVASETFYLMHALNPERAARPGPVQPRVVPLEEAEGLQLGDFDVILLTNIRALSPSFRARLHEFATRGGGVWWFLGHLVDPAAYNRDLFDTPTRLLPARLGLRLDREGAHPVTLRLHERSHPVLEPFIGQGQDALAGVRVRRLFSLESGSLPPTTQVLLSLPDGHPLLLAGSVGRGRVLLLTSTADADWNELPVTTGYLPLVQTGIAYLAEREEQAHLGTDVRIPDPIRIRLPAERKEGSVTVTDPQGKESRLRLEEQNAWREAQYAEALQPGFYRLRAGAEQGLAAVNPPWEESDITSIPWEELREKFGGAPLAYVRWERGQRVQPVLNEPMALAGWFLLGLLALALVEGVFANRLR